MKTVSILLFLICILQLFGQSTSLGSGSYFASPPTGSTVPSDRLGNPTQPKVTANFNQAPQTNDWWSSLMYNYYDNQTFNWEMHSWKLYAHPLSFLATRYGLKVNYPTTVSNSASYGVPNGRARYNMEIEDFTVGIDGLDLSTTTPVQVEEYGDWHVTAVWDDGNGKTLKATIGHGLPYAYFEGDGGDAYLRFLFGVTIDHQIGTNIIGFTHNGHHYGLFAPSGSTWNTSDSYQHDENSFVSNGPSPFTRTAFSSDLNGANYFSIAILPDNSLSTLQDYATYAFSFVTSTQVNWSYNTSIATLTTTYNIGTTAKEGTTVGTLMALYPHQWKNGFEVFTGDEYESARGTMKVVAGSSFQTELKNAGILPALPNALTAMQQQTLYQYLEDERLATSIFITGQDTYWTGKRLSRQADLVYLADQVGHTAARDKFINDLKTELEDWFTATPGESNHGYFYYDNTWRTLIGYEPSFGSDIRVTDHHFHYGYFIKAVAAIAAFDPSWADDNQWGSMAQLLIDDVANTSRGDTQFPFLRCFDSYAGHSWASGHGNSHWGNDQESSSEAINFAASVYLLGLHTGNGSWRDLGLYLYLTEAESVREYWFDQDGISLPTGYGYGSVTTLWGNGTDRAGGGQSFELEPEYWLGIQALPMDGPSLYLGWDSGLAGSVYQEMNTQNGGPADNLWEDLLWMFRALSDPSGALAAYQTHTSSGAYSSNLPFVPDASGSYSPLSGDQIAPAQLYHWLYSLEQLGQVDASICADHPAAMVFDNAGLKNYAAYNPNNSPLVVEFSDGTIMNVPPRELVLLSQLLPVELISFQGDRLADGNNLLKWDTESEINFNQFVLERSTDGRAFQTIHQQKGRFPNGGQYSYIDSPLSGQDHFYRLRLLDHDGTQSYSDLVFIPGLPNITRFYPNPVKAGEILHVEMQTPYTGQPLYLLHADGRRSELPFKEDGKEFIITINPELPPGNYWLSLGEKVLGPVSVW